jgi:basic membrane protein A
MVVGRQPTNDEEPGHVTTWQRRFPLVHIAGALVALVVITATRGTPVTGEASTGEPSAAPSPFASSDPVPRMAIVYDVDGRGTAGFNELAWEGVKRAADTFGAELKEVSASPNDTQADREQRLRDLADAHYYPIFVIGPTYASAVAKVAPEYPGTWFGLVDDGTVDGPKVIGIQFNEEQGAFLVGAAAALTSKTGNIGFVGAAQSPLLEKYEAGFTAGARAADPRVKVQVAYRATAKKVTLAMYDAGADVVFGADGESANGVIEAAHDRGLWAIGADSDHYLMADPSVRGAILTSMLKRADVATYTIAMEIANGVAKDGNNVFGVGADGVGYSTSGGFVDPIKSKLDAFAARIASGEILVPTKPKP